MIFWLVPGVSDLLAEQPTQPQESAAASEQRPPAGPQIDPLEPEVAQRVFDSSWRLIARRYQQFEGRYVPFPGFETRFRNSRKLTLPEAVRELTEQEQVAEGGRIVTRTWTPPREDIEPFISALTELDEPGSWGFLHSVKVTSIEDGVITATAPWLLDARRLDLERTAAGQRESLEAQRRREEAMRQAERERARALEAIRREGRFPTMQERQAMRRSGRELMREVRGAGNEPPNRNFDLRLDLADQQQEWTERTVRMVGFPTTGAVPEQRWTGPRGGLWVAVIHVERDGTVVLMPAANLGRGLDREQFVRMLADRGLSTADFAQLFAAYRREYRNDFESHLIARLEAEASRTGSDGLERRVTESSQRPQP